MMKAFNAVARVIAIFMMAVPPSYVWVGDEGDKDENVRLKLEMIKDPTNMIVHMEDAPLREQMALISTASFCLLQILEQKTGKEMTEDFINNIRAAKGAIIAGKLDKLKIDMIKQD